MRIEPKLTLCLGDSRIGRGGNRAKVRRGGDDLCPTLSNL